MRQMRPVQADNNRTLAPENDLATWHGQFMHAPNNEPLPEEPGNTFGQSSLTTALNQETANSNSESVTSSTDEPSPHNVLIGVTSGTQDLSPPGDISSGETEEAPPIERKFWQDDDQEVQKAMRKRFSASSQKDITPPLLLRSDNTPGESSLTGSEIRNIAG